MTLDAEPIIEALRVKIAAGTYEFSRHATNQSLLRNITVEGLEIAFANGEIIEDYPGDKYGPSCLVLGFTNEKRPLHIQCSYPSRPLVKIITLYEPDPELWDNYRVRKTP